jgi:hypothetical protein
VRNAYKVLEGNPEGRNNYEDMVVDGRLIIK